MEQPEKPLIAVTLERRHWNAIISILEPACHRKGKNWIVWGNQIKEWIQSSFDKSTSPDDSSSVSLSDGSWNAIINLLNNNCPSKGKEWESWGNNIVKRIRDSVNSAKNRDSQNSNMTTRTNQNSPAPTSSTNPAYEDYMKEVAEKMSPLLDALDKKNRIDFIKSIESHTSEARVAITLLELAWKVKPANQRPADTVSFVFLYVLAQLALKNFKVAHKWADYATKSFPNEEISWTSKFICSQLEALDWAVKAQNRETWETDVMKGGWLGLAIGATSLNQKQRHLTEQLAYPAFMLAQLGLNKLKALDTDFDEFFSEVESIADQLELVKGTTHWSQATRILNNLLTIDWNKYGDKADQDKIKKLKMKIQVVLSSK